MNVERWWTRSCFVAFVALVAPACGGGGGDAPLSGKFVDGPVSGLKYSTATHSGVTTSLGLFNYATGENITFSIGDTNLPTVAARPLMSPLTVFGTADFADVRVVNLCRLLQTLDTDGDPTNGITLSPAAHAAATGQPVIDFASATFDTDATVVNLLANGGGAGTLVTGPAAVASLQSQTLVGTWSLDVPNDRAVMTFFPDGTYIMAEDSDTLVQPFGQDGMERGYYTFNPITGHFKAHAITDTNGKWGVSPADTFLQIIGDELWEVGFGNTGFTRVNVVPANPIVGSWYVLLPPGGHSSVVITFFNDGTYLMAEDGNSSIDPNGQDGMERGTYTWNSGTGAFTATTTVDTSGQWGLSNPSPPVTVTITGNTLHYSDMGGSADLTRLIP